MMMTAKEINDCICEYERQGLPRAKAEALFWDLYVRYLRFHDSDHASYGSMVDDVLKGRDMVGRVGYMIKNTRNER